MPLGFHVSKTKSLPGQKNRKMPEALCSSIDILRGYGIKSPCAQIFVSGPKSFKETLSEDEKEGVRRYINENNIPVVIHGAYVDNPWKRAHGSVHNIKQELRIAAQIGATGVIVHLGAGAADDENLKYVIESVTDLPQIVRDNVTLWLEIHTAKASAFTYETPKKIRALFERVATCNSHGMKIGLCIDTAHLFSCGVALDTAVVADKWLAGLPDIPLMLHLNDSASTLGSGLDEHQTLTNGGIWKAYHPDTGHLPIEDSGLVSILNWAESNNIVTILERNEEDLIHDLTLIRQLGYFQD